MKGWTLGIWGVSSREGKSSGHPESAPCHGRPDRAPRHWGKLVGSGHKGPAIHQWDCLYFDNYSKLMGAGLWECQCRRRGGVQWSARAFLPLFWCLWCCHLPSYQMLNYGDMRECWYCLVFPFPEILLCPAFPLSMFTEWRREFLFTSIVFHHLPSFRILKKFTFFFVM